MSDTAIVQKKEPPFFYLHSKKLYYAPSYEMADAGGSVVVKAAATKFIPKVTVEQFRAMLSSQSDKVWSPHVKPSNILYMKVVEGIAPFCIFDVEGYDIGKKLKLLPPLEVMGRLMPKLYEQALADPKGSGCGSLDPADFPGKSEEYISRKISENKARLEALKWTMDDCKADRGHGLKSARPSMADNKWLTLEPADNAAWLARLKPLIADLRPSKTTSAKGKKAAEDANKTFPGLEIADATKMIGNEVAQLAVVCNPGESVTFEQKDNVYYLRMFSNDKKRSRSVLEEEEVQQEDDGEMD